MNYAEETQCVRPWIWLFFQTTKKDNGLEISIQKVKYYSDNVVVHVISDKNVFKILLDYS